MRRVAIVQARMGSARLPGKVLADIAGKSMLARVVARVRRVAGLDELVVATTTDPRDDAVAAECRRIGAAVFRGDETDVLDRYHEAALAHRADVVVRITADCPLTDPAIVELVLSRLGSTGADYACNTLVRTYPRGLDAEAVRVPALHVAWHEADDPYDREHVTPYIYRHPGQFRLLSLRGREDHSLHQWSVDTADDLARVRAIYERLGGDERFGWRDALAVARELAAGSAADQARRRCA
jgi:spore coat polysaccharide biosynthesis protein SpsF